MANVFLHLLNMSLTAGILVVVVVLLRGAFFKAPRWIHCLLWALVAVRLLCPFVIESELSLMPTAATVPMSVVESTPETPATQPVVDTPAPSTPVVDTPITDTPIIDTPVVDTPIIDTPIIDTLVVDTPVVDTPIVNTPTETPSATVVVSTPDTQSAANPWQAVLSVASWVWLVGMVAMAAYAVATTLRLRRRVGEAAHLRDNLWQCDHLRSPFILGVFRPRIYLPSDLDGVARDSVVAHEQAHLHRRDHWWKPLGFLLLTVYWFNPLLWVAYILLCRDIEAACDERVVRDMNAASRRSYSEALLACSAPRRLVSACPLAFGETSVKSRIKSVLSYKKPTVWIIVAALLVSTVAGVCLLTDPKSDQPAKADDDKASVSTQPTDPDEGDDEQPAAPKYATFIHNGEPPAQVTLELDGNGCTYINSILSSQTAWEGTYEVEGDTFLLSFPNDSMTIEFEGDFTGLTLRMGQSDTRMSYEQMSYGDKELKNGAVFERQMDNRTVSFTTPHTISSMNWMAQEKRTALRQQYSYRTGANSNKDLSVIPITSRAELDTFTAEYGSEMTFPAWSYDDAFFEDKMLAAVYYTDDSCSVKPQIAAVEYSGAELVTLQVDVYEPSLQASALGQWFMLAEIPRSEIPYATRFRAVERYHIPTDNYFATYSHPIEVGDAEPAMGWSRLIESADQYRQLVDRLTWYGADIMADTAFTALGYFTFDGEKKYYVSSDGKQLYDGEEIAVLTAADAEWVRYPFSEGVVMDAATASVTGTVAEWSKEGGYLVLEVTDGDAKLGERVRAYTALLLPGSAPAVGYSATLYYDGWYLSEGDYSIIYALDRKWMDADMLGGPDDEPWLDYTVTVKDGDGNPIPGVKISISSENIADDVITDSKGVAKANLPEGIPTGTIEVPEGYLAASEKFTFAAGSDSLTIVLEKEEPTTPSISPAAKVTFVKFSGPSDSPKSSFYGAQYMYPVQPDEATCAWLRQLASRTNWVARDTWTGAYDAYFTIGDDEEYYYIDRVNQRLFHNRRFLTLTQEEVNKLDTLIRGYGIQLNSPNTGTASDWSYLIGSVQEFVDGDDGYILMKVDYKGTNLFGDVVKVSTRFIPRQFFATGSTVCVVYDHEPDADTTPFTIYAAAMNELQEKDVISTGVPLYDDLLSQIQTYFYNRSAEKPDCSDEVWQYAALSEVGAKVVDLDADGQNELVIYEADPRFWQYCYDVYTIKGGKLIHLVSATSDVRYSLCKGGYVCKEWWDRSDGSFSNDEYYRIEGDKLVFLEGVSFEIGLTQTEAYYRVTLVNGEKQYESITLEESEQIAKKYAKDDVTYVIKTIPFSL